MPFHKEHMTEEERDQVRKIQRNCIVDPEASPKRWGHTAVLETPNMPQWAQRRKPIARRLQWCKVCGAVHG